MSEFREVRRVRLASWQDSGSEVPSVTLAAIPLVTHAFLLGVPVLVVAAVLARYLWGKKP
jgi:hypothetical protein